MDRSRANSHRQLTPEELQKIEQDNERHFGGAEERWERADPIKYKKWKMKRQYTSRGKLVPIGDRREKRGFQGMKG